MTIQNSREGSWLEAIGLFQQVRNGDHLAGMRLLETSADPDGVMHGLLRMFTVFLRGEDPSKLDRFVDASFRAGPPPLEAHESDHVQLGGNERAPELCAHATLTEPMLNMLATQIPVLATFTREGAPEVAPNRSLRVWDDHTLVCDEYVSDPLPESSRVSSKVVVAVLNQEASEGYRFIGTSKVRDSGEAFEAASTFAAKRGGEQPTAVVQIQIEQIQTFKSGSATGAPIA